jgi:F0F1-type ATP synthase membrane subunit c/vacuolar-type H+-ATPase subunit K
MNGGSSNDPAVWMGVGIALGAAIGIALGNLALGMGIGIALGGAMIAYQRNKDKQSNHSDDESR